MHSHPACGQPPITAHDLFIAHPLDRLLVTVNNTHQYYNSLHFIMITMPALAFCPVYPNRIFQRKIHAVVVMSQSMQYSHIREFICFDTSCCI